MKKLSVILIALGIVLIICGNVFYGHTQNAVDTGGSASITTFNGAWSVKIPAYFGGVMLLFGSIFLYISIDPQEQTKGVVR
ncbi:hypothetical protein ACFQZI_07175 [Mucilaginibacter lutimaris]|uniref:DUF3098 domain-containing protein n=1 Tax=Mucilaginibacter lutimaris TaxID=931629 RepID=A0ABW2ZEN2_9SPHI